MNKINVAIADDNQRTVEMMTELLEQESDIEVIASADDGEEALRIIKEKQPDVVLLDIIMPKLDGIGVLERLQTEDLSKRPIIIMISTWFSVNPWIFSGTETNGLSGICCFIFACLICLMIVLRSNGFKIK